MTTTITESRAVTPRIGRTVDTSRRSLASGIPMHRLVQVELRKMFDTRSGFWLLASIVITAVLATGAIIAFADTADQTFDSFSGAIGVPMTIILPMIGILAITSEWSQRSGLTTFTLVPRRGRVIAAKLVAAVLVGIGSMGVALGVGALGTVVGSAIAGIDPVWNVSAGRFGLIVLGSVLGMLFGSVLGLLIRNSAGAIVTYFVYTFVAPPLLALLATYQSWFAKIQPWIDFERAQKNLFNGNLTSAQWQHLGVAGIVGFLVPMAVGLLLVRRAEVK